MGSGIITISRQFGSGGHEVGKKLSEKLGIKLYDKELVEILAKQENLDTKYVAANEEKYMPSICPIMHGFSIPIYYQNAPTDEIFIKQAKLIKKMAEYGPGVFIGRCADYILQSFSPINCFIYSEMKERIKRKMSMVPSNVKITEYEMMRRIKDIDKQRAKYHEFYSDSKWGDMKEYDLCICTDKIGIDGAVEVIETYYHKCFG